MRLTKRLTTLFLCLMTLVAAGCGEDTELKDTADAASLSDAESCNNLSCDAHYIELVTFDFYQPDDQPFCGDVTMSYWPEGEPGNATTEACGCEDGEMVLKSNDGPSVGPCHINPDVGQTTVVEVEASDTSFAPFQTTVSLPCECEPKEHVEVRFESQ